MQGPRPPLLRPIAALLGAVALAPLHAGADPVSYTLDPVHTRVVFAVSHAGFSRALGTISGSRGMLHFDRDDWTTARLDVTVPIARLDLGDARWNTATLASGLLDGRRHPEARFVSTRVEPVDADRARVCGELTLRGATGPVCLDVTLNAYKRHPLPPFRKTVGFSASGSLSRNAFGIDAWPNVIGDRVELIIEVEATAGAPPSSPAGSAASDRAAPAEAPQPPATPPAEHRPADEQIRVPPGWPTPPEPTAPEPAPPEPAPPSDDRPPPRPPHSTETA